MSLQDCLRLFHQAETLQGREAYDCERCKRKSEGVKLLKIEKLPELLVLHLKRFRVEGSSFGGGATKDTKSVTFPLNELDMREFVEAPKEGGVGETSYR